MSNKCHLNWCSISETSFFYKNNVNLNDTVIFETMSVVLNITELKRDKINKMTCVPSKGICPVWSEFLLCVLWVAKVPILLQVDSKDWSDWGDALCIMQADLSLTWVYRSFCWFVLLRLIQDDLNSVSSQCAHGKSSLAWKVESIPNVFNGKKTF